MPVVYVDAPQQTRRDLRAYRGFDVISVGASLVAAHLDQLLLQFFEGDAIRCFHDQVRYLRTGLAGQRGTPMTVGGGKVADGLTSQEKMGEHAFFDHGHGMRFDSFIINVIAAREGHVVYFLGAGIIDHRKEFRQYAALVIRREFAASAARVSKLWPDSQNVGNNKPFDQGSSGIG